MTHPCWIATSPCIVVIGGQTPCMERRRAARVTQYEGLRKLKR